MYHLTLMGKIGLAVWLPFSFWGWLWGAGYEKVRAANRLLATGKPEDVAEAVNKYRDAMADAPEEEVLHYNLGTALYKQGKYDKAIEELQKAAGTDEAALAARVHYNLGNCHFRQGKLDEAILAYKKALQFDPNDEDAKFNLELARKRLKEMAEKQKQQPSPSPPQPKQQEQRPQEPQGDQEQREQGQQAKKDQKGQVGEASEASQASAKEKKGKKQEGEGQGSAGAMSKKEALQLLESLEKEEKEAKKKTLRAPGVRGYVEKDW